MTVDNISPTFPLVMIFFVHAGNEPELADFRFMKNERKGIEVKIINRVQAKWEELADLFRLPPQTVDNLRTLPGFTSEKACREVFRMWLEAESDPRVPKTWQTVITVMRRMDNAKLADEITNILED